jgi:hypothetical protein
MTRTHGPPSQARANGCRDTLCNLPSCSTTHKICGLRQAVQQCDPSPSKCLDLGPPETRLAQSRLSIPPLQLACLFLSQPLLTQRRKIPALRPGVSRSRTQKDHRSAKAWRSNTAGVRPTTHHPASERRWPPPPAELRLNAGRHPNSMPPATITRSVPQRLLRSRYPAGRRS